jgi:glycosyltransferase involved in cell wall biosynthesis
MHRSGFLGRRPTELLGPHRGGPLATEVAMTAPTIVVVPAHNEQDRLRLERFSAFAAARVHLIFVDDGSTDSTPAMLHTLDGPWVEVLTLDRNVGKGEAVRRGLQRAVERGAGIAGYLDADLATPEGEMLRLLRTLANRPHHDVVLGARVGLLGRSITRRAWRHYVGRVYATAAAAVLHCRVYDTQCGAKAFRVTPAFAHAIGAPFGSRWAFDVELLGRLRVGTATVPAVPIERFIEIPLEMWVDVAGGKLTVPAATRAAAELLAIPRRLRRYRSTPATITSSPHSRAALRRVQP